MDTSKRWTAIGAVGAMLAGIAEFGQFITPAVQRAWAGIPETAFEFWHVVTAIGLAIGAGGAFVAIWVSARARAGRAMAPVESGHGMHFPAPPLALLVLAATVAAGIAFFATGGLGSVRQTVDKTVESVETGEFPRDTRADPLDRVCANAQRKFKTRAGNPALPGPTGVWTGWTSWYGTREQRWHLAPDGSVRLTAGYPGKWRLEGRNLLITFSGKTIFRARIIGELLCGVRLQLGGGETPDGNFQLVFVESTASAAETDSGGSGNSRQ